MNSSRNHKRAVFIDRDGTMNVDVGYVSSPDQLELYPWTAGAIRLLNDAGIEAVVVTNQSGIARGFCSEQMLELIHARMTFELKQAGARIDAIFYCPHHPDVGEPPYRAACQCRKPQPGLLQRAAAARGLDLSSCFVIGDKASDIALGQNAGVRSALVLTGYGRETLDNPDLWPCEPDLVADNLLEAVKVILPSFARDGQLAR